MAAISSAEEAAIIKQAWILQQLNKWQPHEAQEHVLQCVFGKKKPTTFVECGRKWGKALALDTPIPTPTGFKMMGDLVIGDRVFDEQGRICSVVLAHDVLLNRRIYLVGFSDGTKIKACEDHRWFTETKKVRKSKTRAKNPVVGSVKTTAEIAASLKSGAEWNHSIPNTLPLDLPEAVFSIDPYVLGAWLGDGSRDGGRLTCADAEIIEEIRSAGYDVSVNGIECYIRDPFHKELKQLGLIKNKHVPRQYLRGSFNQRLSLLQGLMDTDGTVGNNGHCCFDNTNENLADSVAELVASLGMKTRRSSRIPTYRGKPGKLCYRVYFKPIYRVFRLSRKLSQCSAPKKPALRFIVSAEEIPSEPVRCITVDSPSHLYLAGKSMIPTHNTEIILYKQHRIVASSGGVGYYLTPEQKQSREIIWRPRRAQNFCPSLHAKRPNESDMSLSFIGGGSMKLDGSDNIDQLRGVEPDSCDYDEFKDFRVGFHNAMSPNYAVKNCPVLICGTPPEVPEDDDAAADYDMLRREAIADGAYFNFPSWCNPHISRDWLKKERNKLYARGEGDVWEREYGARRIIGGKRSIFPMFDWTKFHVPFESLIDTLRRDARKLLWQVIYDPGTTTCFAVLFRAINPFTKTVYHLEEIYEQDQMQTSTSLIVPRVEAIKDSLVPNWRALGIEWEEIYDEAAAWFATERLASFPKLPALNPTRKGEGGESEKKKKDGLSLLKDQMLTGKWVATDRCEKLRKEIQGYIKDKNGRIPKGHDHLIDDMRYGNSFSSLDLTIEYEAPDPDPDEIARFRTPDQDFNDENSDEADIALTEW